MALGSLLHQLMRNAYPFLALLLGAPLLARAQAGLSSYDLGDINRDRPFSARNLNKTNADALAQIMTSDIGPDDDYFLPDWQPGALVLADGSSLPVEALRFNLVRRWVEVRDASLPGRVRVYPAGALRGFTQEAGQGRPAHHFGAYASREEGRLLLEEVVPPGSPVQLLLRHEVAVVAPVYNPSYSVQTQPGGLLRRTRLYATSQLTARFEQARELLLSKGPVLHLFGQRAAAAAVYATTEHLRYDEFNDVLKLVEYCNKATVGEPVSK